MPIGRALDLPPRLLAEDLYQAVRNISHVHGDGILPTIPVFLRAGLPVLGRFIERDGTPIAIQIRSDVRHRGFALLHEVGHFLDFAGLDGPGEYASSSGGAVIAPWRRVVDQSDAVRQLTPLIWTLIDASPDDDVEVRRALRALLDPEEFWARSYAQYIVQQTGGPALLLALDTARTPVPGTVYYPLQWSDEDFAPIAFAIDTLFRRIGWRSQRST